MSSQNMTMSLRILLLIMTLFHCTIHIWSDCSRKNRGDGYLLVDCDSMPRLQFEQQIKGIIPHYDVRRLVVRKIDLNIIDPKLFDVYNYREVYNLTIQQCNVTLIDNNSFVRFTRLDFLYILDNNIRHFDGTFVKSLPDLKILDLSNNNIEQFNIDCNNMQQFNLLTLNHNPLLLQDNSFKNCQFLKTLNVQNSNITIPKNSFKDLISLLNLDLENSTIHKLQSIHTNGIESGVFSELNSLKYLNLNLRFIQDIESGAFIGLSAVENLELKYIFKNINMIKTNQFIGLKSLKTIDLSGLDIINLEPGAFNELYSLIELHLNGNMIKHLLPNIFVGLLNVRYLNLILDFVQIIEPGTFNGLSSVENLNVKHIFKQIHRIQKQHFKGMPKLKNLDLSKLNIQVLEPEAFAGLENSRTILLQNNNISSIESMTFAGLRKLQNLDLSNCNLENIHPNAFNNYLLELNLQSNSISTFPCNIFDRNNSLDELNLSNNKIENISVCTFQNFFTLKTLHLQFNKISELKVGSLSALRELLFLDISHNRLSMLSEASLHPLERIQVLNISGNYFTHLNPEPLFFSHLETLKQIDFSGNLWSCHNLTQVQKYFRSKHISYEGKILNFSVENVAGIQCFDKSQVVKTGQNNTEFVTSSYRVLEEKNNSSDETNRILERLNILMENSNFSVNLLIVIIFVYFCCKMIKFIITRINRKLEKRRLVQNYPSERSEVELLCINANH